MSKFILLALFAVAASSCQGAHSNPQNPEGQLPKSWYDRQSQDDDRDADLVLPDATADRKVKTTINANLDALTNVEDPASGESPSRSAKPADWVPWHLDGMVGYYAVSQGGLLGALLYSGTESIKLTWQKVTSAPTRALFAKPARLLALRLRPGMRESDLSDALEPTVQTVLASGAITNEKDFRTNLLAHAEKFLHVCELLNTVDRTPSWYVDGYQLDVNFSASGKVTPLIGVGGTVNVYFDWSRTTDPEAAPTPAPAPLLADTTAQLNQFVRQMSVIIPEATRNAAEIEKTGYRLDMVQIGLGITAGGDVGVAQAQGGDIGRIILKRDLTATRLYRSPIPLSVVSPELQVVARNGSTVDRVGTAKFEKGVRKAIRMADYFAKKARRSADSRYQLNQIEAEFDLSLGGTLKLATVNGIGQFVLDFDYIH